MALQEEGGRTGETLRFTQSQKQPFSHTVLSVTVHGMVDFKTPLCPTQEFRFYICFRDCRFNVHIHMLHFKPGPDQNLPFT